MFKIIKELFETIILIFTSLFTKETSKIEEESILTPEDLNKVLKNTVEQDKIAAETWWKNNKDKAIKKIILAAKKRASNGYYYLRIDDLSEFYTYNNGINHHCFLDDLIKELQNKGFRIEKSGGFYSRHHLHWN
jgi:hypothetical protein